MSKLPPPPPAPAPQPPSMPPLTKNSTNIKAGLLTPPPPPPPPPILRLRSSAFKSGPPAPRPPPTPPLKKKNAIENGPPPPSPRIRSRPVYWSYQCPTPCPPRDVQGRLWAEEQKSGEASTAPAFSISELESLFAVPTSDQGGKLGVPSSRDGPKSDKVQLLSKLKVPLPDLMSSLLALEDSALDVEQVENLMKFCPTKEMEKLRWTELKDGPPAPRPTPTPPLKKKNAIENGPPPPPPRNRSKPVYWSQKICPMPRRPRDVQGSLWAEAQKSGLQHSPYQNWRACLQFQHQIKMEKRACEVHVVDLKATKCNWAIQVKRKNWENASRKEKHEVEIVIGAQEQSSHFGCFTQD